MYAFMAIAAFELSSIVAGKMQDKKLPATILVSYRFLQLFIKLPSLLSVQYSVSLSSFFQ
jgi:hypothetical protein